MNIDQLVHETRVRMGLEPQPKGGSVMGWCIFVAALSLVLAALIAGMHSRPVSRLNEALARQANQASFYDESGMERFRANND